MADAAAPTLVVGADIRALEAQMNRALKATEKAMDAMVAKASSAEARVTAIFGKSSIGAAMEKSFGSVRSGLFSGATSQLGGFASGLEALGPAGLMGAAGVVALGAAIKNSLDTAKWSADLISASKALHLTTDQIQAFDHVFSELGIDSEKGRETLAGLSETIGRVETGFSKAMSVKAFTDALHITPDQLKGWGDLEHQLPHVLEAMSKLNGQELQGLSKKFGADPGVIATLVDARDKLGDLEAGAKKYGLTIDHEVIAKSAAAEAKLKEASEIIDKNLKVAFAGLVGPIVTASTALAHFLALLSEVPTDFNSGMAKYAMISITQGPAAAVQAALQDRDKLRAPPVVTGDQIKSELGKQGDFQDATVKGARGKRGPADRTDDLTKTAQDDLDAATKALAEAQKGLTDDVMARVDFEQTAIDAEAATQQAKLKLDRENLLKNQQIDGKTSDILQAKIEQAQADTESARIAKDQKALRDAEREALDQAVATRDKVNSDLSAAQEVNARLAPTADQRRQLQTANLLANQKNERLDLRAQLDNRSITPEDFGQRQTSMLARQSADRAGLARDQENPIQKYARESTEDPGTKLQNNVVEAMKSLNDGLAEAIVNGKGLKDTLKSVLKQFETSVLKDLLNGATGSLLGGGGGTGGGASAFGSAAKAVGGLFHLFGFAAGTGAGGAPGGPALVGEHGPEVVNLNRGASVTSNNALRALMSPMRAATPARLIVSVSSTYDMRGTSGDDSINQRIAQSQSAAFIKTMDAVKRSMAGWSSQASYERG